ncbi:MAG: Allophanate hydrolase 2 subunit 1 [Rhizobacter sp.]|nr:Allophanate hydrolase 2 subunit 1 [Rhizobacter sp.]
MKETKVDEEPRIEPLGKLNPRIEPLGDVDARVEPLASMTPRIESLGDQSLVIEFGQVIDVAINERVCALAERIVAAGLEGVVDVVPSFGAVTVHYRADDVPVVVRDTPYAALLRRLAPLIDAVDTSDAASLGEVVEIPVCYGGVHGPDLDEAARLCKVSPGELIALHQRDELRVYMIGFAPGAPYIGLLDERLALPRRSSPRLSVPAGTIAIANRQSVIYPFTAPGGWNLIGRTPLTLFDASRTPPGLLRPGTRVRFKAIDEAALAAWPEGRP